MGYRDVHALLHGLFLGYFLYYEIKAVVNIIYWSTAILLFYVTLYPQRSTTSSASAHT